MNEYQERFKKLPNHRLLRILESAEQYHQDAIAAAKAELALRTISDEERAAVRSSVENERAKATQRTEDLKTLESKAQSVGKELFQSISPIQIGQQTDARKVNFLVFLFGLLAVYELSSNFGFFRFMLTDISASWDLYSTLVLLSVLVLPATAVLIFIRKRLGWILGGAYLAYTVVLLVLGLKFSLEQRLEPESTPSDIGAGGISIDIVDIGMPYLTPHPVQYLLALVFYCGILALLLHKGVRSQLNIDQRTMMITAILAIAVTLLGVW